MAVVGVDVTGADPAVAACVAASLGGKVIRYSNAAVIQFSARSAAQLSAKLDGLSGMNPADAIANAALAQAMKRASVSIYLFIFLAKILVSGENFNFFSKFLFLAKAQMCLIRKKSCPFIRSKKVSV